MKIRELFGYEPVNEKNVNLFKNIKGLIIHAHTMGNDTIKKKWIANLKAMIIIDNENVELSDRYMKDVNEDFYKVNELIK